MLTLLGCGVVANVALARTKGAGGGFLLVNFGWGIAVFAGVYVAFRSGAHLNPAVTLGLLANGAEEYAPGVDVTFGSTLVYLAAEFIGAFLGAVFAWLAYRQHFDDTEDPATQLGVFSTGPAIRNPVCNTLTEIIGTFVLVFVDPDVRQHAERPRPARGRPARRRHRRLARRPDRLRHQPGP